MTSKVAKCERIFSNGEVIIVLEIDYENKRYALSHKSYSLNDGLSWGLKLFSWKTIEDVKDDYALFDLMRQAIEFAEKELKGEDKPLIKQKKEAVMTMGELKTNFCFDSTETTLDKIPWDAKVTFEWTE